MMQPWRGSRSMTRSDRGDRARAERRRDAAATSASREVAARALLLEKREPALRSRRSLAADPNDGLRGDGRERLRGHSPDHPPAACALV